MRLNRLSNFYLRSRGKVLGWTTGFESIRASPFYLPSLPQTKPCPLNIHLFQYRNVCHDHMVCGGRRRN